MATNPIHNDPAQEWPKREGRMTEEEFHELERLNPDVRYEYIAGMVYMMSGGTIDHNLISLNIISALNQHLTGSCTAFAIDVQVLVGIKKSGKRHYLYPDAAVTCAPEDRRQGNTLVEFPKIVFEVLSPGTEKKDHGVKLRVYQNCLTIQEIVFVSQYALYVEVLQRDELDETRWNARLYVRGATMHFASINVDIAIEEFYQRLPELLEEDEEDDV
jgi:Uma2 family endonuclease